MQKWEYCEVEVTVGGPIMRANSQLFIYQADGKHKEFTNQYGILMAMLGNEGWELVSGTWHAATGLAATGQKINYIFKRPKTE